jgi:site-specific DNA-methyltransferase (adenine-specific)
LKDKKNKCEGDISTSGAKTRKVGTRINPMSGTIIKEYGYRDNVWKIHPGNNGNDQTTHPAPFPEALAHDHILSWSNPGDIVLDPMCGSGTTLKMAKQLGRQWIGIDISQEYCDIAQKRVNGANVPLFNEA